MKINNIISTGFSVLEELKQKILAALYEDSPISLLYTEILELSRTPDLGETDEKYLRQIQAAVKRLRGEGSIYAEIQTHLRNQARQNTPWHQDYDAWEKSLNLAPWQMEALFKTAVTFQLTSGCSNFCRRCNEWALPRTRGHFEKEAASRIIGLLLAHGNTDLALYGGSDPLDWEDGNHTLIDLLSPLDPGPNFSLLTKIPRGKEQRLQTIVEQGIDIGVSLTLRNQDRIHSLEQKMGRSFTKQHATPDLLIPACLDEDFQTIKPSITDSYGTEICLDGAFIILPTFTSALYPFGHKKIPVTRDTQWFPIKKLGRPALLQDYFKPLEVTDKTGHPIFLDQLLDVQVENILLDNGDYDLTPPGMRSVKEYFEIFEEKARHQRKRMTISVIKRLKKKHLTGTTYMDLPPEDKTAYRQAIHTHLDFCKKEVVDQARICTVSFFLTAVLGYVSISKKTAQKSIIAHLTLDEYQSLEKTIHTMDTRQHSWETFRYALLDLVHSGPNQQIREFISKFPAVFHPLLDRFVPTHE